MSQRIVDLICFAKATFQSVIPISGAVTWVFSVHTYALRHVIGKSLTKSGTLTGTHTSARVNTYLGSCSVFAIGGLQPTATYEQRRECCIDRITGFIIPVYSFGKASDSLDRGFYRAEAISHRNKARRTPSSIYVDVKTAKTNDLTTKGSTTLVRSITVSFSPHPDAIGQVSTNCSYLSIPVTRHLISRRRQEGPCTNPISTSVHLHFAHPGFLVPVPPSLEALLQCICSVPKRPKTQPSAYPARRPAPRFFKPTHFLANHQPYLFSVSRNTVPPSSHSTPLAVHFRCCLLAIFFLHCRLQLRISTYCGSRVE
jgi:hypothetical protein